MPTYDYRCEACEHEFEEFQSISAGALRKCPECKRLKLKRLIGGGAGFLFKGSGFYETDYRSDAYKKAEAGEKGSSDGSKGSPDKKTPAAESKKKAGPSAGTSSGSSSGPPSQGNKSKKD